MRYERLGNIVNFKRGYDLPSYNRIIGPYPIISSGGESGFHNDYKVEGEGIVIGRYGTLGKPYFINGKYWPHNTSLYVTDFKGNYPKYVYYLLTCLGNLQTSDKSTVPGINRNDLHEINVPFQEKSNQKQIAKVLSDLDSKIDLNNRINQELEALAKLIYDYWFVQFDFPDANGKPYKSSGGKMVYNAELKREIPEGWEDGELSDIANITMGQSPPGESYNEEGEGSVFYQGCTDFGTRFPSNRKYTVQPSRFAKKGDILLSVRAPVGTMNIANEDCCIGRGLAALNSRDHSISYLDGVMQYFKQIFDRRNSDGTTFGSITKGDLFSLKVVKPEKNVLLRFEKIANPLFEKQNLIGLENQKLSELRDWLLPMLMNGQVKVSEAGFTGLKDDQDLSMAAEEGGEYG